MRPRDAACSIVLGLGLGACATVVDPAPDFDAARALVRETTGRDAARDPEGPVLTDLELRAVLADGLSLDEAATLALTNNRRLQAGFLELGVGRADFVQAGLLENPSLSLAFLLPSGGGRARLGADLVQDVAGLWQVRRREEAARLAQDRRILELSRFAGRLVLAARTAYCEALAAREARLVAEEDLALALSALLAVERTVAAGVATRTEEDLARTDVLAARLFAQRLERAESSGKERLAALLSLHHGLADTRLTDELPGALPEDFPGDVPGQSPGTGGLAPERSVPVERSVLVERGAAARLDVRAARQAVAAAEAQLALERRRANPDVAAGLSAERTESGSASDVVGGFAGTFELPIFDRNTAQIRRAEYRRDALQKELEALVAEVSADIRAALDRATLARRAADFVQAELLPQAERAAALALRAHELGETTVLALLESRRRVVVARREAAAARLELALALIALEESLGAPLESVRE